MILSKKIKKYVKEWGIRLTAKIFRLASLSYAPIGFRLKCEPTCLSANGFQDFSRNPTLTQNNRKYQTIENAENPVKYSPRASPFSRWRFALLCRRQRLAEQSA